MGRLKHMKQIKVTVGSDPILNQLVQLHAISLGYNWEVCVGQVMFVDSTQLFFNYHGHIYRGVAKPKFAKKFWALESSEFLKLSRADVDYLHDKQHEVSM